MEITYTTVYRNETDATQQITIADPYPEGKGMEANTEVECVAAKTSVTDEDGNALNVPVNVNATDAEGNRRVLFGNDDVDGAGNYTGRIKLVPGDSVVVKATYRFRTVKTVAHHAIIGGTEDGEVETNTVAHKVKRDLEALLPVLPLRQSSMLKDERKTVYNDDGTVKEYIDPTIEVENYVLSLIHI